MESAEDGSYQGWLLDDITPNEDFTAWTGNLKQGITFHNGVELTAQTIADMFPIQQEGSQSAGQIAASGLADVQATGDYEVTWTLSRPNSAFPAYLARAQLGFVFEPGAGPPTRRLQRGSRSAPVRSCSRAVTSTTRPSSTATRTTG